MTANSEAGSLRRGIVLLKLLATAGRRGLALTEIAAKSGIPHPSAHRILGQLIEERLAEHRQEERRYRLGPLAFELGVAGATMHDIRDLCEPVMRELARETDDTSYLIVRSGFDAVCMHRVEGSFPIQALVLQVGSRRPLGVGAGGLAILSAIEAGERLEIIRRVAPGLAAYGDLTERRLAEACERSRNAGMAVIRNRVTLGIAAVGVCLHDSMGQPLAALSVAALTQRMTARRIAQIGGQLQAACKTVEQLMRRRRP